MNNLCYNILIKQVTCQNGVPRIVNNTYSNIKVGTIIQLSFGYTIKITAINDSNIEIMLSNPNYISDIYFTIPISSYKQFNLPKENGTLRVYVGIVSYDCCCSNN